MDAREPNRGEGVAQVHDQELLCIGEVVHGVGDDRTTGDSAMCGVGYGDRVEQAIEDAALDLFESAVRFVNIAPFEATGFGDAVVKIGIIGAHGLVDFGKQGGIDIEPLSEQLMCRFRIACERLIRADGEVSSIPFAFRRVLNHLTLSLQGSLGRRRLRGRTSRCLREKTVNRKLFGTKSNMLTGRKERKGGGLGLGGYPLSGRRGERRSTDERWLAASCLSSYRALRSGGLLSRSAVVRASADEAPKNTQTRWDGCFGVCMVFGGTQKALHAVRLSNRTHKTTRARRERPMWGRVGRCLVRVWLCWVAHGLWLPFLVYGETSARGSKQRNKETTKADRGQQGNTQKSSTAGIVDGEDPSESLSFAQFAALWSQGHLYGQRMTQLVARSFGEWLGDLGGVSWGGSDPAGGSLWLRGGGGGRVAIRLDGLPLLRGVEELVGERPLAGLALWDVKEVTLLRGPTSVYLGDHGLLGGLLLRTEGDGWEEGGGWRSWRGGGVVEGHYTSGAQGGSGFAKAWVGMPIFGARLSGGYEGMQAMRTGGGEVVPESGYQRGNLSAKLRFSSPARVWENRLFYTVGWLRDAVRVDQLPPYGDRVVLGRQQHLGYVDSRLALPFLKTRLRGMFGVQFLEEDRLVERLASVGGGVVGWREERAPHLRWDGLIHGESRPWSVLLLRYGVEFSTESLEHRTIRETGQSSGGSSFLGQARQNDLSFFLSSRVSLPADRLRVEMEGGIRVHNHWRDLDALASSLSTRWAKTLYAAYLGIKLHDARAWSVRLFFSDGFRTPNMAEMGRFGVFGQAFFIPNTELNEERTRALEGTFTLQMAGRVQTSVRFFLQALSGWLALQPASYRGQSAVGGLPVYQYQATEEVVMLGAEATLAWQIIGGWSLRAEIGWLDEMGNGIARPPTPIWPPASNWTGRLLTRYDWKGWGGIEVMAQGATGREARYLPPWQVARMPSASWWTMHIRADLRLMSWMQLLFSVRNLLDQSYIPFPSRYPAMGRDIHLALRLSFS